MPSHYIPIMPTKAGELAGLTDVAPRWKASLAPLFMIHPINYDFEADRPSKTADEHVADLARKIVTASTGVERAFLDPILITDEPVNDGADDPFDTVLMEARERGSLLIPVVRPDQKDEHTDLVARVHQETGSGVCLRLTPSFWPSSPTEARAVEGLLRTLRVDQTETDLVLDLGAEVNTELAPMLATSALQALPDAKTWRTVTLAGGAFPEYLTDVPKDCTHRIPRREWTTYERVRREAVESGHRQPLFGDYVVANPDPTTGDVDPKVMNISAAIRYTVDDAWLVAKGGLFKGTGGRSLGGAAAIPVARLLAGAPEFCGPDYSAGDAWIDATARGETNGGSPQTWRRHGTSHHLTFVSESLATRF